MLVVEPYLKLYARLERVGDDQIVQFVANNSIAKALLEGHVYRQGNIGDTLDDKVQPLPLTLETLSVGDEVLDKHGMKIRVLMAQGVGEYRTYRFCEDHKELSIILTAYELKRGGYQPVPWETQEKRTLADVLTTLSPEDREIVQQTLNKENHK